MDKLKPITAPIPKIKYSEARGRMDVRERQLKKTAGVKSSAPQEACDLVRCCELTGYQNGQGGDGIMGIEKHGTG